MTQPTITQTGALGTTPKDNFMYGEKFPAFNNNELVYSYINNHYQQGFISIDAQWALRDVIDFYYDIRVDVIYHDTASQLFIDFKNTFPIIYAILIDSERMVKFTQLNALQGEIHKLINVAGVYHKHAAKLGLKLIGCAITGLIVQIENGEFAPDA